MLIFDVLGNPGPIPQHVVRILIKQTLFETSPEPGDRPSNGIQEHYVDKWIDR